MATSPSTPPRAIEVLYADAHRDEDLRTERDKHLSSLRREGVIAGWHDRRITAGTEMKIAEGLSDGRMLGQLRSSLVTSHRLSSLCIGESSRKPPLARRQAYAACRRPRSDHPRMLPSDRDITGELHVGDAVERIGGPSAIDPAPEPRSTPWTT